MSLKLGTQEGADEFLRIAERDYTLQQKLKGLSLSLILLTTNAPGNEDRQLEIILKDGKFLSIVSQRKPAPSDLRSAAFDKTKFEAKVIADHNVMIDLIHGRINVLEIVKKVTAYGDVRGFMDHHARFAEFIEFIGTMRIER